jgi:flagellar biogenesis protein FliO
MRYVEKNLSMILIVLMALAMIFFAIWFFERRISKIEKRMKPAIGYLQHVKGFVYRRKDFQLR